MHDAHIVAIVAIVFTFAYLMLNTIVRAIMGGAGRRAKTGDDGTQQSQRELYDLAMRLQSRVESLERLLDSTQPEWRGKP